MGYTPVFGSSVKYVLLGSKEISDDTLLRWYVLHVLLVAVRDRHLHGRPLLARPQGRRHLRTAVGGGSATHGRGPRTPAAARPRAPQGARPPRRGRGRRRRAAPPRARRAGGGEPPRPPTVAAARGRRRRDRRRRRRLRRRADDGERHRRDPRAPARTFEAAPCVARRRTRAAQRRRGRRCGRRHGDRGRGTTGADRDRARAVTPSGCSRWSSRGRSSRPAPRPRTRCTCGRTCSWSSSPSILIADRARDASSRRSCVRRCSVWPTSTRRRTRRRRRGTSSVSRSC